MAFRNYKGEFAIICAKAHLHEPAYTLKETPDKRWLASVTHPDLHVTVTGEAYPRKIQAEQCAAQRMIEWLDSMAATAGGGRADVKPESAVE
jgi:dsRNA-specific ribonuclease